MSRRDSVARICFAASDTEEREERSHGRNSTGESGVVVLTRLITSLALVSFRPVKKSLAGLCLERARTVS
jgi:hypothetical protein